MSVVDAEDTLLTGVRTFTAEYYSDLDHRWFPAWTRAAPPQLVRVNVAFDDKHSAPWLPLIIQPRVDTDPACEFDVVRRRCREAS